MRLIKELCAERQLAAIINIHDVQLAQLYADRIIGLRAGELVFDGLPDQLDAEILTRIYGEEDWNTLPDTDASEEQDSETAVPMSNLMRTAAL